MKYYIADMHLNCNNKHEDRIKEVHDQLLKENWNKKVTNADDVYILGDIGKVSNKDDMEYILSIVSTLKGNKHFIIGNHDKALLKDIRFRQLFVEIKDYEEVQDNMKGGSYSLILSHYPIMFWNGQHRKYIHLYGHVHITGEYHLYQELLTQVNHYFVYKTLNGATDCPQVEAYNVGCMLWNYQPVSLAEILGEKNENI